MVFHLEEFLGLSVFHPSQSVSDHVAFFSVTSPKRTDREVPGESRTRTWQNKTDINSGETYEQHKGGNASYTSVPLPLPPPKKMRMTVLQ